MFLLGPILLFIVRQRLTYNIPPHWRRERWSVHRTNCGLLAVLGVAAYTIGLAPFLLVHFPIVAIAAAIGSWLFFVQHQYERAYWQPHERWSFVHSALEGSSYYRLPQVLQWFTGNIGFHHIHHLESRIPNYNLPKCHAVAPELRQTVTLGLFDSATCVKLKLWDEQQQRMITFKAAASIADRREAVLSLLSREEGAAAIASRMGEGEPTLYRGQDEFLAAREAALVNGGGKKGADRHGRRIAELEAQIEKRDQVSGNTRSPTAT
jgi:fatty acid desaturase